MPEISAAPTDTNPGDSRRFWQYMLCYGVGLPIAVLLTTALKADLQWQNMNPIGVVQTTLKHTELLGWAFTAAAGLAVSTLLSTKKGAMAAFICGTIGTLAGGMLTLGAEGTERRAERTAHAAQMRAECLRDLDACRFRRAIQQAKAHPVSP